MIIILIAHARHYAYIIVMYITVKSKVTRHLSEVLYYYKCEMYTLVGRFYYEYNSNINVNRRVVACYNIITYVLTYIYLSIHLIQIMDTCLTFVYYLFIVSAV